MSNSDARFGYGCPLGSEYDDKRPPGHEEMDLEIEVESTCNTYYWWWGESFGYSSNGFDSIPKASDELKARVQARWEALSPELQQH